MFNFALLKQDFKINARVLLVTYALQIFSLLLAVGICEMKLIEISDIFWDTLPTIVIPAGMQMMLACRVMKRRMDDGTMDFLLATSLEPSEILASKVTFLVLNAALLTVFSALLGCVGQVYSLTGVWSRKTYLLLNVGSFCLQVAVAGWCFWMSAGAKRTAAYVKLAVGLPLLFYGIYVVYYLFPNLFLVQYLTIFSLFRQEWFASESVMMYVGSAVFLALGIVCFLLGRYVFFEHNAPD